MVTKRLDLNSILLNIGIFLTILSFCPSSRIASFCSRAMYIVWGLCGLMILFRDMHYDKNVLFMLLTFGIMTVAGRFFNSIGLYRSSGPGPAGMLLYCAIFYFVGYNLKTNDDSIVTIMALTYVTAQMLFIILARQNDVVAKNQSGQVIGAGIIIELFYLPTTTKKWWKRSISIALGLGTLAYLFMLHSRTPFLGVVMMLLYLFVRRRNKLVSYIVITVLLCAFLIYRSTPEGGRVVYRFLQGDNRYSTLTVESVSSGRFSLYQLAIRDFLSSPLIGVGAWAYIDSFPFHVLRTGGLLAALLLFPIAYGILPGKILYAEKYSKAQRSTGDQKHYISESIYISMLFSFYYIIISFFEGYPPIGPNASVFFLWILIGNCSRIQKDGY